MQSTTVRISEQSRKLLGELATQEGMSMQAILEKALEMYRRHRFLEATNAAYAALRQDHDAWEAVQQERAMWDTTLEDGLEVSERWLDTGKAYHIDERRAET
jgi:hypothetical protein